MRVLKRFPDRQTDYVTFRRTGGFMDEVFRLHDENIFICDPFDDPVLEKHKSKDYYNRLQRYVKARRDQGSFSKEPYRFYALYDDDSTQFPHGERWPAILKVIAISPWMRWLQSRLSLR